MRRIIDLIRMPEWWFSAVFIAIIASVIAAFAKDWISRGLSAISQAYRTRATLREAMREEKAAVLAAHPRVANYRVCSCCSTARRHRLLGRAFHIVAIRNEGFYFSEFTAADNSILRPNPTGVALDQHYSRSFSKLRHVPPY
jgi:hypothetical protein